MLHDTFRDRWFRGRKGMKTDLHFPFVFDISFSILKCGDESGETVFRSPRLDSIRACFLHMAAWSRSDPIWCGLATYPAIVEISTAADRQSGFRLHRIRQRDLKSFVLINRIFGWKGGMIEDRLEHFFRNRMW